MGSATQHRSLMLCISGQGICNRLSDVTWLLQVICAFVERQLEAEVDLTGSLRLSTSSAVTPGGEALAVIPCCSMPGAVQDTLRLEVFKPAYCFALCSPPYPFWCWLMISSPDASRR